MASVARPARATSRAASFGPAKRVLGLPVSRSCSSRTCRPPPAVSLATACRVSSWRGFVTSGLRQQEEQGGQPESSKESQKSVKGESEPLRILYCGSDDFSIPPLEALWSEHRRSPKGIEKIQVLVRPGKPTGRGYKTIREPPLKAVAAKLGLEVIERDTFTGWQMPPGINLIVAVSFGLKVPKRLLTKAQYGGLNLHPSMLPDLRGPAPLHHALLLRREKTGVTLQTLHPTEFDRGEILAQTPLDAQWDIPRDATVPVMVKALSGMGAGMLVNSLRKGLHTGGQVGTRGRGGWLDRMAPAHPPPLAVAPKITTEDRRLVPLDGRLPEVDVDDVAVRQRVIGPLWFVTQAGSQRVIIDEAAPEPMPAFVVQAPFGGDAKQPWEPVPDDEAATTPPEEPEAAWPPRTVRFHRCTALAKTDNGAREYDVQFFTTERGHLYLMERPIPANACSLVVGLRIHRLKIAGSPAGRAHTIFKQLPVSDGGVWETTPDNGCMFERRQLPTERAVSPVRPKYEYVLVKDDSSSTCGVPNESHHILSQ